MDVGVRQCPACGGGACGRPRTRSISAHNLRVGPAENSDDRRRIFLIDGSRPLCVAGRAAARLTDRRARWSFSSSIFSLCFFFFLLLSARVFRDVMRCRRRRHREGRPSPFFLRKKRAPPAVACSRFYLLSTARLKTRSASSMDIHHRWPKRREGGP